ncbi:MAG TPA: hypothetical protein VGD27_04185 [Longimicrobiales bacterium]
MSSFKGKVQIVLLTMVILLAAGAPAQAGRVQNAERAEIRRVERKPVWSFASLWLKFKTRYAMGAN